ncbi:hypothetical protein [Plantactinospora sp. B5E13]|uniref:hypothetical protein n=1 Tax=unclassified Plantactinospora TaxID=2631981 RepID=UPI00325C5985
MPRSTLRRRLVGLLGVLAAASLALPLTATATYASDGGSTGRAAAVTAPAERAAAGPSAGTPDDGDQVAALVFQVNTGGPAMNLRSCPRLSCSSDLQVPNGGYVTVDCQTLGDTVTGYYGTSAIWDRVLSGMTYFFASDTNIRTGYDGFHPGLPRC